LTQYGATIYSCSEFNCKTTQGQFTVPNSVNTTNKMWVRNETELCICSSPASTYPRKYSSLDSDRTKVSTLITSIDSNKEVLKALINSCVPQWTCSNWTGCTGGKTTRVCTVTNNCLDNVIITPVTQTKCTACYDSDKNNYLYKGTTRGIFTPTSSTTLTQTSKTDVCLNSKTLREYYCSDTLYASYVDVNCPKSCSYGKCH
jgi:hypothetical protein